MSKKHNQKTAEKLAQLSWSVLGELLNIRPKKLPDFYFFLSDKSKGSLKKRDPVEIKLVHAQQSHGEAITLLSPPAAWVSEIWQAPEEAAHLFALVHQKYKVKGEHSYHSALRTMIMHEAFGMFSARLLGQNYHAPKHKKQNLWERSHWQGYELGHKLANIYFDEKLSIAAK